MRSRWTLLAALIAVSALAQTDSPTLYAESFRKGPTHIVEDKFEARLSPTDPNYRERVHDAAGIDRYELTITPQGPQGDNKITSWRVQLRDLRHPVYHNLLVEDQAPSEDPKNNLWWLNPNRFGGVPIRTRRIVKVDAFYVVFQVENLHFTPLDSPYLDSMVVRFELTNRDPRTTP